jgi:hypothetical protein
MRAVTGRLFTRFDSEEIEREIEEELRFHLEMLTQEHLKQDMSFAEAKDAALKRLGNVEQIKDKCVEISRSGHIFMRALKSLLITVFLLGVLVRVVSTEFHVMRVGDTLILVAILGRLFLYVRALNPSNFRSKPETSSPLMLNEEAQTSITAYDHRRLTPVERVIADK